MLKSGEKVQLQVMRAAPFGFFLSDGNQDILLHQSEVVGKIEIGEWLEVFLYHDHQDRLAATCNSPILLVGQLGWLKVSGFDQKLGFFLDNGIAKELLLPKSELPNIKERWPKPGFEVFVKVGRDRQGRMIAELGKEAEILEISQKAEKSLQNKEVVGRVYNETKFGAFIYTEEGYVGLIHREEMLTPLALGQRVSARVTNVRDDGRLNLSMRPRKEISYVIDAEKILTYMKTREGKMPYGDHTPPDIIQSKFQMSKGAFKRALGKLMKDGLVKQEDGWTIMIYND